MEVERLGAKIVAKLSDEDLMDYQQMIEEMIDEQSLEPTLVAAALAKIANGDRPLQVKDPAPNSRKRRERPERGERRDRFDRDDRRGRRGQDDRCRSQENRRGQNDRRDRFDHDRSDRDGGRQNRRDSGWSSTSQTSASDRGQTLPTDGIALPIKTITVWQSVIMTASSPA